MDGSIDEIRQGYGASRLRVHIAGDQPIPAEIAGVTERRTAGAFTELTLADESARAGVLATLSANGDVTHFETVKASLHDIFVQIARFGRANDPNRKLGANADV